MPCNAKFRIFAAAIGDLAHLVERQVRNLKVAGSSPVISTKSKRKPLIIQRLVLFLRFG